MFENKRYVEINREERHFCGLFVHALLSSELVRTKFSEFISSQYNIDLNPDDMQIFLEAAALRDYWNDLGDARKYDANTHKRRQEVLEQILMYMGYDNIKLEKYPFFYTRSTPGKLWNPGHWNKEAIKGSDLPELILIKWVFNAKPDIMLISNNNVLLIEAKLESHEGKYDSSGEGQLKTQIRIAELIEKLIPVFSGYKFNNMLIALDSEKEEPWPMFMSWRQAINMILDANLDTFTTECFAKLSERHYKQK